MTKNDTWGYVSGEKPRPDVDTGNAASRALLMMWIAQNKKTKSDLILSISPELQQIRGCVTSRDI